MYLSLSPSSDNEMPAPWQHGTVASWSFVISSSVCCGWQNLSRQQKCRPDSVYECPMSKSEFGDKIWGTLGGRGDTTPPFACTPWNSFCFWTQLALKSVWQTFLNDTLNFGMSASLCHHSLTKVAASYRDVGKQSSTLANVNESVVMSVPSHSGLFKLCNTGQTTALHRSGERNKMAALGYVNTWRDKLCTCSNAVLIGLPQAPRNLPFMSICKSSYTT